MNIRIDGRMEWHDGPIIGGTASTPEKLAVCIFYDASCDESLLQNAGLRVVLLGRKRTLILK